MPRTSESIAYHNAKQRCTNPNDPQYDKYGGRGILFKFDSFEQFLSHIGPKPSPELYLDRIENNKHYEIGNVRWTTRSESSLNRRRWVVCRLNPCELCSRIEHAHPHGSV